MDLFLKILVVLLAIVLFVVSYYFNQKTKAPSLDEEEREECSHCTNIFCKSNGDKMKCEDKNEK